jgi:DNA-binding response OmpR family regulator
MDKPFALIIEDDPKLGVIFQTALEQAGFRTDIDPTGGQYTAKLSLSIPTLVILDIHLPYASGKDILLKMRSDTRLVNTTIIVATADLFMTQSLEKLADYVLIKPVSVGRLLKIISDKWPNGIDLQAHVDENGKLH